MLRTLINAMLSIVVLAASAQAQDMLHGMVHIADDAGRHQPVRGAAVSWVGTPIGKYTDSTGHFTIARRPAGDTLKIYYPGYQTAYVVPGTQTSVMVLLEPAVRDEVTVTGERNQISNAPQRTEVISSRDLTKAACCSLAESFEKSPTVEVSYSDAVSGARQIQLLGLRGTYTQFLTEAVPSIRGMELPWGLDHIPGPFMESVSISKGASSVTHGFEAMTGQINVEYRKPTTTEPLFVNIYGNTLGRGEINLVSGHKFNDELSMSVMAHGRLFTGEFDQNTDGFLDVPKFRQLNVLNRWEYWDDEIEVQVLGRAVVDDYAGGTFGVEFGDMRPSMDTTKYGIITSIERYEAFAKFGILNPFDGMDGSSIAFVVNGSSQSLGSVFGIREYDGSQRSMQARAIISLPFADEVKFIGGFSFAYDDVQESILDIDLDRIERVPGVFGEVTLRPIQTLTVIGGFRVDEHNLFGTFWTPRVHTKWNVTETTVLRASAGKGYRVPTMVAENISSFITSMRPVLDESLRPEVSWNYGVSGTHTFELLGRVFTLDAELYHTEFENQLLVDYDKDPSEIHFRNLNGGRSFATSAMVQLLMTPIERLDVNVAYRWVDVQATFGDTLRQRPMMPRERVLITASYATEGDEWRFDLTYAINSGGRLPSTAHMPPQHRRPDTFPGFSRLNGQITKKFGDLDIYVGIENATNFYQQDPIITPSRPYGPHFDASMAWGPTDPRMVYAGIRFSFR
jgi:outer membrane receptor for ferrienterochelin and colicins